MPQQVAPQAGRAVPSAGGPQQQQQQRQQQQQQQQQPAGSESVNFSRKFTQQQRWADDAASGPAAKPPAQPQPASQPVQTQGGAAGANWLQGLLAEADFSPFGLSQGSQQPPAKDRPALAERQPAAAPPPPLVSPLGLPTAKRQCTGSAASPPLSLQQEQSPPIGGPAELAGGWDGIDELDLDLE